MMCNAPLLHDYAIIYKSSGDRTIAVALIGNVIYLFIWVLIWLLLTIKQKWAFKVQVSVSTINI